MSDRWTELGRRLVPAELRQSAFDPALADLVRDWASGRRSTPGSLGRRLAIVGLVIECRRLAARDRLNRVSDQVRSRPKRWLMSFMVDLRRAVRRLVRQPVFFLVAVLTLGLGIGANVAVFSYFNAFVLATVPVPNGARVVRVYPVTPAGVTDVTSYQVFKAVRAGAPDLDVAAHASTSVLMTDKDETENRVAELVTGDYFGAMGVSPRLGRLLDRQDDVAEGAHPVVVVAESLWRARFSADPAIVGRAIRLNGKPFTIVGVVPAPFRGTLGSNMADVWAPLMMQQTLRPRGLTLETPGWGWLSMVGALGPETTRARAERELSLVAADMNRQLKLRQPISFTVRPATLLPDRERRAIGPYLQLMAAFTALILLAAAANLAGLMQTRVAGRRRDTAIRQSLGASRWRLAGEWLAESLVLSTAGGLAGMLLARGLVMGLEYLKPPATVIGNVSFETPFDWRVFAFGAGASLLAGIVFGLGTAWRASRSAPAVALKDDLPTMAGGRRGWRRLGVIIQVSVSAVLLLVAALLVAGLDRARTLSAGFATDHLAVVSFRLPPAAIGSATGSTSGAFTPRLLSAVRRMPGVAAADVTRSVPLSGGSDVEGFRIPGHLEPDGTATPINDAAVGAGYFDALGLRFVRGHAWDPDVESRAAKTTAVVINETMAHRFWDGRDPVGTTMDFVNVGPVTIAGVVADTAYYEVGEAPLPFVFVPAESIRSNGYALIVRTSSAVDALLPTLTRVVNQIDPGIVAANAASFDSLRAAFLTPHALLVLGAAVFGLLALGLTAVGLYGVVAASVAQRTREIGLRVALGARPGQVLGSVIRQALALVAVGTVLGLAAGYAMAGTLRAWTMGINPLDPRMSVAVVAVLAVAAIGAAWVPARRAAHVDPVTALRAN